jgi:two-component system, cell cycle sensor histidine kinase and response regulator CckA
MPDQDSKARRLITSSRLFTIGLVSGIILINLVVIGLAGFYLYRSRQQVESRVATQTQNLSQSLSLTLSGVLDKTSTALFSTKQEAERQLKTGAIDLPALNAYLLEQKKRIPELDGLRVTNAAGDLICGDRVVPGLRVTFADRKVFIDSKRDPHAGLVVGPPVFGRVSNQWNFHLAYRINNPDGSFAGVVFGAIPLDYLSKMFSNFDLGSHGAITLRNQDLTVVVRYPPPRSIGSKKVSREWQALHAAGKTSGTYRTPGSLDTVERIFSFYKASDYPLYLNVGLASSDYLASWVNDAKTLGALAALFSSVSLLSAWLIHRNRKQSESAAAGVVRYREHLEETVSRRTAELERKNLQLADEIEVRKKAEADWQKAAAIMDKLADAVNWLSRDGAYLYVNDAACAMHGYSREEILTRSVFDVAPDYPPEAWAKHWEKLKREGSLHFETKNVSRDGRIFPVEVTANYLNFDGVEYNCAIIRDLSEREESEAEKQALMVQLAQAQKMESVGRLAGGIAHDFNNLLTPVLGYAEMLQLSLPTGSRDYERVRNIHKAADRAKVLTQQLLSFSRKQILDMKTIDMNEVVRSFYDILRRTIREDIAIQLHLTRDLLGIRADHNQIAQILMNLAINAQDAIEGNGVITIETAPITIDAEYLRQHADVTVGDYLMLAVTDSGCGMDEATLSHIFEPFFTTKGVGHGSGLGLATVYGLVRQHDGHIWVYSEKDEGSVFKIYFPVVSELPVATPGKAVGPIGLDARGRTILLVEDNEMVRRLAQDLLESFGAEIIVCEGPKQALSLSLGRQIDLLLTDVVMPEMNGPELHRQLLVAHPALKVLYMSGYTNDASVHQDLFDDRVNFIRKPFTVEQLAHMVEAALVPDPA